MGAARRNRRLRRGSLAEVPDPESVDPRSRAASPWTRHRHASSRRDRRRPRRLPLRCPAIPTAHGSRGARCAAAASDRRDDWSRNCGGPAVGGTLRRWRPPWMKRFPPWVSGARGDASGRGAIEPRGSPLPTRPLPSAAGRRSLGGALGGRMPWWPPRPHPRIRMPSPRPTPQGPTVDSSAIRLLCPRRAGTPFALLHRAEAPGSFAGRLRVCPRQMVFSSLAAIVARWQRWKRS